MHFYMTLMHARRIHYRDTREMHAFTCLLHPELAGIRHPRVRTFLRDAALLWRMNRVDWAYAGNNVVYA
jgi:hypothetical protein